MIEAFTSPPYRPESNHAHAPRLFSFFLFNKAVSSGRSAQARTRRKVTNDPPLLTSSNRASNRPHRGMATSLNEEVRSVLGGFEYNRTCLTPESRREPMKWYIRQTSGLPASVSTAISDDQFGAFSTSRHRFIQYRLCATLRCLAQCLVLVEETMRRQTGVPINPTRDAATTGTRTKATDLSSSFGGTPSLSHRELART
jgi:hypothetical protein